MTEYAPNLPPFPDPREVLHAAVGRLKEILFPGQEFPHLEAPESDIALYGLRAAKENEPERKVTPIPPEDPEDVKARDRVKDNDRRHYRGGRASSDRTGSSKSIRPNSEKG